MSIHRTAIIEPFVDLGVGVVIHPFAWLGKMPSRSKALGRGASADPVLRIGDRTEIGPYSVIYAGVEIGADCMIGDHVSMREGCRLGDRCFAGQGATFNYDCHLADDVRIHTLCHVGGGIRIGRGTFWGPGVVSSNDRHMNLDDYRCDETRLAPPVIGEFVMVGTGANILAGVTIGNRALIGAGALVVDDVPEFARVLGPKAALRGSA